MKSSVSLVLVVICTVVLAAQQSQAKKGCNAYGHACYGGHGKRSLTNTANSEQDEMRPEAILQVFPNDAAVLSDPESDVYPRYRLIKIMKSWFGDHSRRRLSDRTNDADYPEALNRESNNSFN